MNTSYFTNESHAVATALSRRVVGADRPDRAWSLQR
jgi:hypothetical protein